MKTPRMPESTVEHIRNRPGMYVGGANGRGLRGMVCDIVQELLDAPGARVDRVTVAIEEGGFLRVEAVGEVPYVPPGDLISEPDFGDPMSPLISLAVAAALCDSMDVEVVHEGRKWSQRFGMGRPLEGLREERVDEPSRVRVRCHPDGAIFKEDVAEFLPLCGRVQELAVVRPAAILRVVDERKGLCRDFPYPMGTQSFLEEAESYWLGAGDTQWWHFELNDGGDRVEAAVFYRCVGPLIVHAFANGWRVRDDGSHVEGFIQAWEEVRAKVSGRAEQYFGRCEKPGDRFTVAIALTIPYGSWESSTKDRLFGKRPRELVYRMIAEQWPGKLG